MKDKILDEAVSIYYGLMAEEAYSVYCKRYGYHSGTREDMIKAMAFAFAYGFGDAVRASR